MTSKMPKYSVAMRQCWGRWSLDTRQPYSLNIKVTRYYTYEIVLNTCQTESSRRRWIEHMSEKRWIEDNDLVNLSRAFDALLSQGMIKNDRQ